MGVESHRRLTFTLQFRVQITFRAVPERAVIVPYIFKEVYLITRHEKPNADRVYRSVTPALIKKFTRRVQVIEEGHVCIRAEEIKIGNFKV